MMDGNQLCLDLARSGQPWCKQETMHDSSREGSGRGRSGRGTRSGSLSGSSGRQRPNFDEDGDLMQKQDQDIDSSREGSGRGRSGRGTRSGSLSGSSGRQRPNFDEDGDLMQKQDQDIDASYSDPLGPAAERPKTAARIHDPKEDEFGDEELGDDLLPE